MRVPQAVGARSHYYKRRNRAWRGIPSPFALILGYLSVLPGCEEARPSQDDPPIPTDEEIDASTLEEMDVECVLEPVLSSDRVSLRMRLTNRGENDIEFLPWNTAWDDDQEVLRVASPEGLSPTYVGAFEPHPVATLDHLLVLPAGEHASAEYSLEDNYDQIAGRLEASLMSSVIGVRVDDQIVPMEHSCGIASYDLAGELVLHRALIDYNANCTASQQAELDQALPIVEKATFAAARHAIRDTPLFRKYFGPWTSWKGDEVAWHYNSTHGDWIDEPIRCGHADCTPTTFALVPAGTDHINFCPNQWGRRILSAGTASADWGSMVGTTVHEFSHATGIDRDKGDWSLDWTHGGNHPYETVDIVDIGQCLGGPRGNTCYGPVLTVSLAQDPTCSGTSATCKAMWNAGNYEFYAQEVYKNLIVATTIL